MKKCTRTIELPIEPELVVKIVSELDSLFKNFDFVKSIERDNEKYTIAISVKGVIKSFEDKYDVIGKYDFRANAYVVLGHGSRSRFALVITPRASEPNTVVRIDLYLDGVGGYPAKRISVEFIEKLVDYLWFKTREYLESMGLEEKIEEKPGPSKQEVSQEVSIEIGIDEDRLGVYNSVLSDVIKVAKILLDAKLIRQSTYSNANNLFSNITELINKSIETECKYILLSIKLDKDVDAKILIDTGNSVIIGAILTTDEKTLLGKQVIDYLSKVDREIDVRVWGLKEV